MEHNEEIRKAAEIIKNSNNVVVFTGAGASTESGIPDFRSPGGLWSKYDPDVYASYFLFLKDPKPFWTMHLEVSEMCLNAEPNPAHYAIVDLEKMGKLKVIITQNVDMLHQKAGSGSINNVPIFELHGAFGDLYCMKCRKTYVHDDIKNLLSDESQVVPHCECGGVIKPTAVLFGEQLPLGVIDGAFNACNNCDCLIMIGTSLVVSPANRVPFVAKNSGAKVIFVNKDDSSLEYMMDVFLKGLCGEILPQIIEHL